MAEVVEVPRVDDDGEDDAGTAAVFPIDSLRMGGEEDGGDDEDDPPWDESHLPLVEDDDVD